MAKDQDYKKLINSVRWLRLRHSALTAHPLCVRCEAEGLVTPATEVHHRRPVETALTYADKERLMFDPDNLSPLCHRCHVQTHIELGRSGKEATKKRNAEHLRDIKRKFFGE